MKPMLITENLEYHHIVEKRKYPRFDTVMKYILVLGGIEYNGIIENISGGGASLVTFQPIISEDKLMQEGEITLFVDENFTVQIRCRISHIEEGQNRYPSVVGIDFINPDINIIAAIIDTDI